MQLYYAIAPVTDLFPALPPELELHHCDSRIEILGVTGRSLLKGLLCTGFVLKSEPNLTQQVPGLGKLRIGFSGLLQLVCRFLIVGPFLFDLLAGFLIPPLGCFRGRHGGHTRGRTLDAPGLVKDQGPNVGIVQGSSGVQVNAVELIAHLAGLQFAAGQVQLIRVPGSRGSPAAGTHDSARRVHGARWIQASVTGVQRAGLEAFAPNVHAEAPVQSVCLTSNLPTTHQFNLGR